MHNSDQNLAASRADTGKGLPLGIALSASSQSERKLIVPVPSDLRPRKAATAEPVIRNDGKFYQFGSRLLDIACSIALIVVLLPAILVLTAAVALSCSGSPIFAHKRVGKGGRIFKCYKFRSMHFGAEQQLAHLLKVDPILRREWERDHKLANDPRITPLGRTLRATSIDEIPQLFNVLIGQMSLVGPRPIVSAELARYGRFQASYLCMKPGLTGLWQVTGRSGSSYRRRVATDRLYARKKSFVLDCKILIATVPAVLTREGAC